MITLYLLFKMFELMIKVIFGIVLLPLKILLFPFRIFGNKGHNEYYEDYYWYW